MLAASLKQALRTILLGAMAIGSISAATAEQPQTVRFALVLAGGTESSWEGGLIAALERIKVAKPHGLDVEWTTSDPLWGDDAGEAMRLYAESGKYDIVWAHGPYSDQVAKVKDNFPNIPFMVVGSGNTGLDGNQYWVFKRVHEVSYLSGMIAGSMSKSGVLGVVGTYPADDVNDEINAFFAGAREFRSDAKQKVAFVESWYDPGKAAEYTRAQVAAGADAVLQLAGNFEACKDNKLLCFGSKSDESHFAPDNVVTSAVALWDPDLNWIIDEWWNHATEGKPYQGNAEPRWFSLTEGGVALAPFHKFDAEIPADIKTRVAEREQAIRDGSFKVPIDTSLPASN